MKLGKRLARVEKYLFNGPNTIKLTPQMTGNFVISNIRCALTVPNSTDEKDDTVFIDISGYRRIVGYDSVNDAEGLKGWLPEGAGHVAIYSRMVFGSDLEKLTKVTGIPVFVGTIYIIMRMRWEDDAVQIDLSTSIELMPDEKFGTDMTETEYANALKSFKNIQVRAVVLTPLRNTIDLLDYMSEEDSKLFRGIVSVVPILPESIKKENPT